MNEQLQSALALPADAPAPETLAAMQSLVLEIAADAGDYAAEQFRHTTARRKFDGTLVTQTDEYLDRLIANRIRALYPDHAVLSEEQTTSYDPACEFNWVVDPIDGTTNFARGLLIWGVSIGLLWRGWPVMGVLAFPLLHETYRGIRGGGAFRNDQPLEANTDTAVDTELLMTVCTRASRYYDIDLPLKARVLGSAAYHLCKVAEGTALLSLEVTPKIWDLAGVAPILHEAGALLRSPQGESIFPVREAAVDYRQLSMPALAAANQAIYDYAAPRITRRPSTNT